jgi:hypothetical protein
MPSIEQQYEEALISLAEAEASVAAHPGWQYAKNALAQAKRAASLLAAQVEVESASK